MRSGEAAEEGSVPQQGVVSALHVSALSLETFWEACSSPRDNITFCLSSSSYL